MAVVLTLVQTKQIRINIHKRNNTKNHGTNNTKYSQYKYRGAGKSLARPRSKQATATEDFEFYISYL